MFCEVGLPDGDFRDLLGKVTGLAIKVPVVVASRLDDWDAYLEAMQLGAFDYIARPYRQAEVEWIVSRALRMASVAA